ncbi:elongation factor G [candidate division KSB1 bacterium]|nr:MAG: elongation factor G [candidate division KSB1 bacterium]
MKEFAADKIRNIALAGHGGVGKTSFAEALVFTMGETNRLGTIDEGTTISDYHADEIERKISISSSALHGAHKDCKINILDTPGYSDFLGDTKGTMSAADTAVVVVSAVDGIEVGTEQVISFADEYEMPKCFFINRLDNEHADFDKVFSDLRERFGTGVVAFQFPVNQGEGFNKIVDILKMKLVTFDGSSGKGSVTDLPDDLKSKAEKLKNQIVEAAAESDDELLEIYFDKGSLDDEQLQKGIRAGILSKNLIPVLCGSAAKNMGSSEFLDFLASYAPSPADLGSKKGSVPDKEEEIERKISVDEPFSAFVFKTISEAHVGELSLIKVISGSIKSGDDIMNASNKNSEKVGQMYLLNGKKRKEAGVLAAGDIGALVKLKHTSTSDTLCDSKNPIVYPKIKFPEPVISVAIYPKSRGDEDKISNGLHTLHDEDPSFTVVQDAELKQTIISGQGELHLKVIIDSLKERFGVEVDEKRPKIPYRETITAKADDKYRHKKQTGGAGQFAEVWMKVEPLETGKGFEFQNIVKGGAISSVFIPAIEKGIKDVLSNGPVAGYKVVDVKAIVYDGKEHPVDSKEIAFQTAGREVFKACMLKAKPILLEPIYDVEVKVPEEYMGDVMGDLSGRRGKIGGMDSDGHFQIVKAKVPLAELDRYATTLRSITSGRGLFKRSFSHYEPVPKDQEKKIIEQSKREEETEE